MLAGKAKLKDAFDFKVLRAIRVISRYLACQLMHDAYFILLYYLQGIEATANNA
jgi:hypothetical protein